jgi:hypothetical protein
MVDVMITDVAHAERTLVQPTLNNCYSQNEGIISEDGLFITVSQDSGCSD